MIDVKKLEQDRRALDRILDAARSGHAIRILDSEIASLERIDSLLKNSEPTALVLRVMAQAAEADGRQFCAHVMNEAAWKIEEFATEAET